MRFFRPSLVLSLPLTLSLCFSVSAHASEKLCTGTAAHPEFKGMELKFVFSAKQLVVSPMPSNKNSYSFVGEFDSNKGKRLSKKKVPQLGFEGYEEGGFNEFWADANLLEDKTTGLVEVTNHDEGDTEATFDCKDFPR